MGIGRREMLLGGAGLGLALAAGRRPGLSQDTSLLQACSTYGLVPGGGTIDQTAALQAAIDEAAETGTTLFLPAGIYSTSKLTLRSGTRIEGAPGETILRYRGGGALLALDGVTKVRLSGLVLDGEAKPLQERGSLLAANETRHLDVANCRLIGSAANGISLREVSGSIKDCEIADIGETAILSQDADGLEITNNLIEKAAGGVFVANFTKGGRLAVIQGNLIRNLFMRKDNELRGFGIAVEADSVVTGNVIEDAPAYGIMIGWGPYLRNVSVTGNLIRDVLIGIGVSVDPSAGSALIAKNSIASAKEGAIRAMSGPAAIGPDLATANAGAFAHVAAYANVAR